MVVGDLTRLTAVLNCRVLESVANAQVVRYVDESECLWENEGFQGHLNAHHEVPSPKTWPCEVVPRVSVEDVRVDQFQRRARELQKQVPETHLVLIEPQLEEQLSN